MNAEQIYDQQVLDKNQNVPSVNKAPTMYDTYECTLSPELQKMAKDELREDENTRNQSLAQFREWIAKHPHIKRCRTDAAFLLRFLRVKKFSVQTACEMLEKYLVIRQTYPRWFGNLDIDDPEMSELLDTGFLVPLIEKSNKRSVILACPGRVDPTKFTSEVMVKAFALMCEVVFHDEETQIAGFVHINDDKNFSMAHLTLYPLTDVRTLTKCMQNSAPMRQKQFIFFNVPPVAQKLIEFVMNVLNEKLRKRIAFYKNAEELTRDSDIDVNILPEEYGGKVPIKDMIDAYKQRARAVRSETLGLDDMYIEIVKNSAQWLEINDSDMNGVIGSFRKLEVD